MTQQEQQVQSPLAVPYTLTVCPYHDNICTAHSSSLVWCPSVGPLAVLYFALTDMGLLLWQVQLLFRQRALVEELEEMKRLFDEALLRLHHEKTQLDCTMLTANLK